jgi:hypothetical protein
VADAKRIIRRFHPDNEREGNRENEQGDCFHRR